MRKYVAIARMEVHLGFIVMLVAIVLLSSALAVIYYTKTVDHQATIITGGQVQTYLDVECTQIVNSRDWGNFNVSAGNDNKTFDFYLRNEGNVRVNVTWIAHDFSLYSAAEIQYETSSWKLYLAKVEGGETKLRPENDTTPSKISLLSGQIVHLRFCLTALDSSPPESLTFQTSFNSRDD